MRRLTAVLAVFAACVLVLTGCKGSLADKLFGKKSEEMSPAAQTETMDDAWEEEVEDYEMEEEEYEPEQIKIDIVRQDTQDSHTVTLSQLPESYKDAANFDLTNEYEAGAAVMGMLALWETDEDAAYELLDVLMGPENASNFDKSFLQLQIDAFPYVIRSYMKGATPENNYEPESITFTFTERADARAEEGTVRLSCASSGADTPRSFILKQKKSTGEWFLFSDSYKDIMTGVQTPAEADKWN